MQIPGPHSLNQNLSMGPRELYFNKHAEEFMMTLERPTRPGFKSQPPE